MTIAITKASKDHKYVHLICTERNEYEALMVMFNRGKVIV